LLADSHCHLDWFKNPEEEVEKAELAGVKAILSNSTGLKSIEANLRLAKEFEMVKCAVGIHPVDLLQMPASDLSLLPDFVEKSVGGAVAIGEVGMDFKRAVSFEQRSLQESFFRKFVELAVKKNLPVVVHARYCETECLAILEELGAKKVHMHWFTNSKKASARAVSLGYKISCGPIILSDNKSADVVKEIPVESLMLETDAPVEFGGHKSGPSWIPRVCLKVAELKNISPEEVSRVTGRNFADFYGK
jgi:TatD DNase family protein